MLNYRRVAAAIMVALWGVAACGERGSKRLEDSGFRVAFESHKVPLQMNSGEKVVADVTVKNISSMTWPSKPDAKNGNAVNLSYHWLNKKRETLVFDGMRTPLPRDLEPGDSVALKAAIQAPEKAGTYTLEITLVQERVAWFPERGGEKLSLAVTVVDAVSATEETANQEKKKSRSEKAGGVGSATSAEPNIRLWYVQVASFGKERAAANLAQKLTAKNYDAYVVSGRVKGEPAYRVRVGHLANRGEAQALKKTLGEQENLSRSTIANQ
jgi:cell division septation protein DedD